MLALALVLLICFALESLVKGLAWGADKYRRHSAWIDLVSLAAGAAQQTLPLWSAFVSHHLSFTKLDPHTANFRSFLLVCQSIRALKLMRIFAPATMGAVERVASHGMDHIFMFGTMLYVAAIVGNELFASRFDARVATLLPNWEELSHIFNFDDFSTSLLALFEVSLTSNWFVVSDAAVAAAGPPGSLQSAAARCYFLLFKVVTTIFYLPILTGFVIVRIGFGASFVCVRSSPAPRRLLPRLFCGISTRSTNPASQLAADGL